jgi:hypothetical protein
MRTFHLLFTTKFSLFELSPALDVKYDPGVQTTFYTPGSAVWEAVPNNTERQDDTSLRKLTRELPGEWIANFEVPPLLAVGQILRP